MASTETSDALLLRGLKEQLNAQMLQEAEPIIQRALQEVEVAMRKRLAANLIARLDAAIDMYRDERRLVITIRNPEEK